MNTGSPPFSNLWHSLHFFVRLRVFQMVSNSLKVSTLLFTLVRCPVFFGSEDLIYPTSMQTEMLGDPSLWDSELNHVFDCAQSFWISWLAHVVTLQYCLGCVNLLVSDFCSPLTIWCGRDRQHINAQRHVQQPYSKRCTRQIQNTTHHWHNFIDRIYVDLKRCFAVRQDLEYFALTQPNRPKDILAGRTQRNRSVLSLGLAVLRQVDYPARIRSSGHRQLCSIP